MTHQAQRFPRPSRINRRIRSVNSRVVSRVKGKKFSPPDKKGNTASVHTITRFMTNNGVNVMKKIRLYNSSINTNAPIINAMTGLAYYTDGNVRYKVGSSQEDELFKVRFLTREENLPGLTLFYDSPDQYERHLGGIVNESIKKNTIPAKLSLRENIFKNNT